MKNHFKLIMMLLGAALFTACDNDVIWDYTPIDFIVEINNPSGDNLLDPSVEGNVLGEVSVTFEGETYPLDTETDEVKSRACLPHWHGAILKDNKRIIIGQFDGAAESGGCMLHIGKQQYELSYQTKFKRSGGIKWRAFYLDGKKVQDDGVRYPITIIIE